MKTPVLFKRAIVAGCLVVLLAGCSQAASPSKESSAVPASGEAETAVETLTETESEKPASAGAGGWMGGIPASVPAFEYGAFDQEQSSVMQAGGQAIYSLYYEDVTESDVEAYLGKLEAAGFGITLDNASEGISAAGELMEGSEKVIGLSISLQDSGHVDYTINVMKAAPAQ